MKKVIHEASSRGHANHGWLNSYHTFSFANYHNPERVHFGNLRVLNDDTVAPGRGFGTHPHDNMEIISIPLSGDLKHQDSLGNATVIREGDVQVMSAGTGVAHSEYNNNQVKEVKFLQIWVFPDKKNVEPRYDQISLKDIARKNEFYQILSPNLEDQGVWIHQQAWFNIGEFDAGQTATYKLKGTGTGVYIFVLEGNLTVDGEVLSARDGMGVWETATIDVATEGPARVLLMEVQMMEGE